MVQVGDEAWVRELNRDLRRVGRLPRILSAVLMLVFLPIVYLGWLASHHSSLAFGFAALAIAPFVFALFVRAWTTADALVVRSYLVTHVIRFTDVTTFIDSAYSGMWNRSADTDSWLNCGMRMIDVALKNGRTISLRATLTGRRTCARIVDELNARLPQ
jgi:hypothetical protein